MCRRYALYGPCKRSRVDNVYFDILEHYPIAGPSFVEPIEFDT